MIIHNQVRRMVGAAVAAAVGRLDLEASGNITRIRGCQYVCVWIQNRFHANPDPNGPWILVVKLHFDFVKRSM